MEFVSFDPSTEEVIGRYAVQGREEVACAVARAREAAVLWGERSVEERCALLDRWRYALGQDADTLSAMVHREVGKPLQEALGADLLPSLDALRWVVRHAPLLLRRRGIAGTRAWQEPVPLGVVGVIGTWNYPLFLNVTPIAWAVAAGNAVVWKPSELATATALLLQGHCERVGLPVFVMTGDGTTGQALCRCGCDKIAFTGSVRTGRAILAELAPFGTPSVMELSGNDAMIVCEDAAVAEAARAAVWARCCNAGQSCVAPQRIYVHRAVYAAFLEQCRGVMQGLRAGVDYGPLRTVAGRDLVHRMVWDAVPRGARLLCGGYPLTDRPGYFYAPTLLADCHNALLLYARDFFGPVVAVCPVKSEEEAVRLANASAMALGASVWTRNGSRGRRIAGQLCAGLVSINEVLRDAAHPALPFGGARASGYGKQRGAAGLDEFVLWKTVVPHAAGGARRHLFPYDPSTLSILRGVVRMQVAEGWHARRAAIRELLAGVRDYRRNRARGRERSG